MTIHLSYMLFFVCIQLNISLSRSVHVFFLKSLKSCNHKLLLNTLYDKEKTNISAWSAIYFIDISKPFHENIRMKYHSIL